LVKGFALHYYL